MCHWTLDTYVTLYDVFGLQNDDKMETKENRKEDIGLKVQHNIYAAVL